MRIIAKRKDYYDCIQAQGQDQSLVYIRNPEEIKFTKRDRWPFPYLGARRCPGGMYTREYIVGFCGMIYPVLELYDFGPMYDKHAFCHNMDDVDAVVAKQLAKDQHAWKCWTEKLPPHKMGWRWFTTRRHFAEHFETCDKVKARFAKMFEDKKSPIFVATHEGGWRSQGQIVWNASLRELEFFRIFDPYMAFQEIAMFLGNMAMPEKVMPVIPDDIKAESKGFNKWSFRKPPSKKR